MANGRRGMRTRELAYSSRPPIGAKMTPTRKNRGRTVLGVKMGLLAPSASDRVHARVGAPTAMP
jgi:hypothetical protein